MTGHDERQTPARKPVLVIRATSGWPGIGLGVLATQFDLLTTFVRRDIKVQYQQTLLGPLWLLIQPLVTTLILALMISHVARLPTDGIPASLFYLSGTIVWSYFSQAVNTISQIYRAHEDLFAKIYFPRVLIPCSAAVSGLVGLCMQLAMAGVLVIGLMLLDGYHPALEHLWLLPLSLPILIFIALGTGLLVASSTAKYRDFVNIIPFALQSGFLITPIVFAFSMVPAPWRPLYAFLNPLAVVTDLWRAGLGGSPLASGPAEIILATLTSCCVLLAGMVTFRYSERTAADTI